MKTTLITLSACLAVLVLAEAVALVGAHRSNQQLRATNQKLGNELAASQALTDVLRDEKQEAARQLVLARDALETLQTRILEMDTAGAREAAATALPPVVTPYQAQAFLGRELLGLAWVIPRNLRMDTNAQRYVYEPVIALDESFRGKFVTSYTNVIEREVPVTVVENNHYPPPVYYVTAPLLPRHGVNPLPQPPQTYIPPPPAPKFDPGNGTTTPQRLGTPASAIKTRPQVPAQPSGAIR